MSASNSISINLSEKEISQFNDFINQKIQTLIDRKMELMYKIDEYKTELANVHIEINGLGELLEKTNKNNLSSNNPVEIDSENSNANDVLRFIILNSSEPLTTSAIYSRYKDYNLKNGVIMNTSKISTRLTKIASNKNSGIIKTKKGDNVYFSKDPSLNDDPWS